MREVFRDNITELYNQILSLDFQGIEEKIDDLVDNSKGEEERFEVKKVDFVFKHFSDKREEALKIYDELSEIVLDETETTRNNTLEVLSDETIIFEGKDLIDNFDDSIINQVNINFSKFVIGVILGKLFLSDEKDLDEKDLVIYNDEIETLEENGEKLFKSFFEIKYLEISGKDINPFLEKIKEDDQFNLDDFLDIYLDDFENGLLEFKDNKELFDKLLNKAREIIINTIDKIVRLFNLNDIKIIDLYTRLGDSFEELGDIKSAIGYHDLVTEINSEKSYVGYNNNFKLYIDLFNENNKKEFLELAENNIDLFIEGAGQNDDLYGLGMGYYNKYDFYKNYKKTENDKEINKKNFSAFSSINNFYLYLKLEENIDEEKKIEILNLMINLLEDLNYYTQETSYEYKGQIYNIKINILDLKKELLFLDYDNFEENFNDFLKQGNKFLNINTLLDGFNGESDKEKKYLFGIKLIELLKLYFETIIDKYGEQKIILKSNMEPSFTVQNKSIYLEKNIEELTRTLDKQLQINLFKFNELLDKYDKQLKEGNLLFNKYDMQFINNFLLKDDS